VAVVMVALLSKIIEDNSIQGHDVPPWHHFTFDSARVKYTASDILLHSIVKHRADQREALTKPLARRIVIALMI